MSWVPFLIQTNPIVRKPPAHVHIAIPFVESSDRSISSASGLTLPVTSLTRASMETSAPLAPLFY